MMKKKLSSRKFWALVAGFVGSMMVVFNAGENEIAQITALVTSFGAVVAYILAEASIDRKAVGKDDE